MEVIRTFTGPSKLTGDQVEWVEERIRDLPEMVDEIRTGCADGLDSVAAWLQWFECPEARHRLFVPSAYHNEKLVNGLGQRHNVEIIRCPRKTQRAEAYRTRNIYMVCGTIEYAPGSSVLAYDPATELEAFVFQPNFYRSGEWMTINIARNNKVKVNMHVIPSDL